MRTSRETIASITDVSTIGQRASSRILRNKTNGVIDAPFKQEKVLVQKQTTLRSTIPRVALTNVTNKTIDNSNQSSKITKLTTKTLVRPLSSRKRSGSNPVVERNKVIAATETITQVKGNPTTTNRRTSLRNSLALKVLNDQEGKTTSSKVLKPVVKPSVSIKSTSVLKQKSTLKSSVVPDRPALNGKVTRVVRPALAVVRESWDDLDAIDEHDIGMASEYVVEIFEYMRTLELTTLPDSNYMADQTELTWSMRSVLVEWLVEVHMKFSLLPETLYLAINILDRFLSRRVVSLPKLQLVGITAMFIACKYEEIINPGLTNFVRLADNGYTEEEVLKSELYVLSVLDYGLHFPNPMNFLRRVSKAEQYDLHSRTLGKYLMEVTLLSEKFVGIPASMIVAACTYFARKVIGKELWNENLKHYAGDYSLEDTVRLADRIQLYLSSPSRYPAVYKKYESKKFMKVAGFVADWILKQDSQFDSHATTLDVSAENESVTLCESGDDSE